VTIRAWFESQYRQNGDGKFRCRLRLVTITSMGQPLSRVSKSGMEARSNPILTCNKIVSFMKKGPILDSLKCLNYSIGRVIEIILSGILD